ncbi:hypothetical protein C922_05604, partial [Plasmodium inui San Antonio 1]
MPRKRVHHDKKNDTRENIFTKAQQEEHRYKTDDTKKYIQNTAGKEHHPNVAEN